MEPFLDPLASIRQIVGTPRTHIGPSPQTWPLKQAIGIHPRFRGSQEIRVSVVGESDLNQALIETYDKRNGDFLFTRALAVPCEQIEPFLIALLKAEEIESHLFTATRDSWPTMPLFVSETAENGTALRVILDEYKNRIQIKTSKHTPLDHDNRNNEWAVFGGQDVRPIICLLIQAFDAMPRPETRNQAPISNQDSDHPF